MGLRPMARGPLYNRVRFFAEKAVESTEAAKPTPPPTPPKPKASVFSRAKAFTGGFLLSSGIAFYLLYYEVSRTSEVILFFKFG